VIRLNDEQYWLYAAIDPETNKFLHTKVKTTRKNVIAYSFFRELREKHDVEDAERRLPSPWPRLQMRTPRKSEQF
jgi:putative transposase